MRVSAGGDGPVTAQRSVLLWNTAPDWNTRFGTQSSKALPEGESSIQAAASEERLARRIFIIPADGNSCKCVAEASAHCFELHTLARSVQSSSMRECNTTERYQAGLAGLEGRPHSLHSAQFTQVFLIVVGGFYESSLSVCFCCWRPYGAGPDRIGACSSSWVGR